MPKRRGSAALQDAVAFLNASLEADGRYLSDVLSNSLRALGWYGAGPLALREEPRSRHLDAFALFALHECLGCVTIQDLQEPHVVQTLFSAIARRYDLANRLLSGGMDVLWRRKAAGIVRGWAPRRLLDLAAGSGDLALALRRACPGTLVIAADFCVPMLQQAVHKRLSEVVAADALSLPFESGAFDVVTVAFGLRNMASYAGALQEMRRVLGPAGRLLVLDFSVPPPPLRWIYRPYLHWILPMAAGLLTGERGAYEYLGQSIERFPAGRAMCDLMEAAGFCEARALALSGGIVTLYTAACRELK